MEQITTAATGRESPEEATHSVVHMLWNITQSW